jgi:long-chain acyl-CoA synthetase
MHDHLPSVPGPYNLVSLFEESVKKFPDNPLFGTKNSAKTGYDWVTYRQVAYRVDNFRAGLAALGVNRGDAVSIIANNRTEWAVAAYATYGRGARFIPMYEAELIRIWKYIITDCGAKVLLVSRPDIYEKVKDFPAEIPALKHIILIDGSIEGVRTVAQLEEQGLAKPVASIQPKPEEIAGLIYTSGTTGNPKGVLLSHRNLSGNAIAAEITFKDFGPTDRTLSFLPWAHSFGQTAELHMLVYVGACTGFAENTTTIVSDLALVQPTILVGVPRIFNKIYEGLHAKMKDKGGLAKKLFDMGVQAASRNREVKAKGGSDLINSVKLTIADKVVFTKIREAFGGRLRFTVSSSAALSVKVAEFIEGLGIPLYEAWGMTELSPAHTVNAPGACKMGSVGKPIFGSSVEIDKTVTGEDSPDGEIIAYGPNVMVGYHNLPKETAEVLRPDGGMATGDRGRLDADGFLYITGRIKEQYKLENGKYVFPSGIEETITLSPYIENCVVYGDNKPFNVALIVPSFPLLERWAKENSIADLEPAQLVDNPKITEMLLTDIKRCCAQLAGYEIPKKIFIVQETFSTENGILTPTLKVKRREIMKRWGAKLDALYQASIPK